MVPFGSGVKDENKVWNLGQRASMIHLKYKNPLNVSCTRSLNGNKMKDEAYEPIKEEKSTCALGLCPWLSHTLVDKTQHHGGEGKRQMEIEQHQARNMEGR